MYTKNGISKFVKFTQETNSIESFESVVNFIHSISDKYAPSTLWQCYSCLNKYYTTYKAWRSFNETPILKNYISKLEKDGVEKKVPNFDKRANI